MKYRAIVQPVSITGERARQSFSTSKEDLIEWADRTLPSLPDGAEVLIYETQQVCISTVTKEEARARNEAKAKAHSQ